MKSFLKSYHAFIVVVLTIAALLLFGCGNAKAQVGAVSDNSDAKLINADLGLISNNTVNLIFHMVEAASIQATVSVVVFEEDGFTPRYLTAQEKFTITKVPKGQVFSFPRELGQYDVFEVRIKWGGGGGWEFMAVKYLFNCRAPLPILLTAFRVEKSRDANIVKWVTASETGGDYVEIQKSSDGREFWPIARIPATGPKAYQYQDRQQPILQYYRLRLVDKDSTEAYSKVVAVYPGAKWQYQVTVGESLIPFELQEGEQPRTLILRDTVGKLCHLHQLREQMLPIDTKLNIAFVTLVTDRREIHLKAKVRR